MHGQFITTVQAANVRFYLTVDSLCFFRSAVQQGWSVILFAAIAVAKGGCEGRGGRGRVGERKGGKEGEQGHVRIQAIGPDRHRPCR